MLSVAEILLLVLMVVFFIWVALIEYRLYNQNRILRALFTSHGIDFEKTLRDFISRLGRADEEIRRLSAFTDEELKKLTARTARLEQKQPLSVQHVGVVRFNPFMDRGGDQSFAIALLDDRSDGVVFSGLHARAETRVYAKPVVGGASTYPLTEEEKEAITRALGNSQVESKRKKLPFSPPSA